MKQYLSCCKVCSEDLQSEKSKHDIQAILNQIKSLPKFHSLLNLSMVFDRKFIDEIEIETMNEFFLKNLI